MRFYIYFIVFIFKKIFKCKINGVRRISYLRTKLECISTNQGFFLIKGQTKIFQFKENRPVFGLYPQKKKKFQLLAYLRVTCVIY